MLTYVAGKYTDSTKEKIQEHIDLAKKYAAQLWDAGMTVICPHENTEHFEDILQKATYQDILIGDFEIILRCDIVFLLPNWKDSEGAKREKFFAEKNGIFVTENIDELNQYFNEYKTQHKHKDFRLNAEDALEEYKKSLENTAK